jgi:serine/threonine protein kinase
MAVFEDCGSTVMACTFAYAAPETLEDAPPTKKVNIFAFGLILYELLAGEESRPTFDKIRMEILYGNGSSMLYILQRCYS